MKLIVSLLLIFASASSYAAVKSSKGRLLSMAVGEVKGHVVTSREVNMNFLIEKTMFAKSKKKKNLKDFYAISSKEFSREVTAVLIEWVVFFESGSFQSVKVSKKEVNEAIGFFQTKMKSSPLWKKLGSSQKEVRSLIKRKLQAKKFIKFKIKSSAVPITDDEARKYFRENKLQFGNLPFENFSSNIKRFLSRQQVDRRLKDWFEVLQNKYKVRNFLNEL